MPKNKLLITIIGFIVVGFILSRFDLHGTCLLRRFGVPVAYTTLLIFGYSLIIGISLCTLYVIYKTTDINTVYTSISTWGMVTVLIFTIFISAIPQKKEFQFEGVIIKKNGELEKIQGTLKKN
jgi:hypothetical protein